jgi:hypothetical protein
MNCIRRVSCTSAAVLATLLGLLVRASAAQTLSTPVASPASGIYSESQSVQLTADTGAEIRYTLNGAEPQRRRHCTRARSMSPRERPTSEPRRS